MPAWDAVLERGHVPNSENIFQIYHRIAYLCIAVVYYRIAMAHGRISRLLPHHHGLSSHRHCLSSHCYRHSRSAVAHRRITIVCLAEELAMRENSLCVMMKTLTAAGVI